MKSRNMILALAFALVLCVSPLRAQDQQQDNPAQGPIPPIPPVTPDQTSDEGNHQMPAAAASGLFTGDDSQTGDVPIQADTHALGGAEAYGLGSPTGSHNLFDPALHLSVGGQTGIVAGQTDLLMAVGGSLNLNHDWRRYQLTVQYGGAAIFYHPASYDNTDYQHLSLRQAMRWRRTTLVLRDDFVESAGSAFSVLNTGGIGLSGSTNILSPLESTISPSASILTGQVNQVSNVAIGEVDYELSRRSTLTFAGSYGLLQFLTSGYIDSRDEHGRVGYSYQLDRKNFIGFSYDYDRTIYPGTNVVTSNAILASYGHKITGRMAFQLSGGPQIYSSPNVGPASSQQLSWSANSALAYQRRHTGYSVSYGHAVTDGSGVLLGAQSHIITGGVHTVAARFWTASLSGGYAFNESLAVNGANAGQYGTWYGVASLGRLWDHFLQTTLSYSVEQQTTNGTSCPVLNCGPTTLGQAFGLSVDIHPRPIALQ